MAPSEREMSFDLLEHMNIACVGEEACRSENSPRGGQIWCGGAPISVAAPSRDSLDGPVAGDPDRVTCIPGQRHPRMAYNLSPGSLLGAVQGRSSDEFESEAAAPVPVAMLLSEHEMFSNLLERITCDREEARRSEHSLRGGAPPSRATPRRVVQLSVVRVISGRRRPVTDGEWHVASSPVRYLGRTGDEEAMEFKSEASALVPAAMALSENEIFSHLVERIQCVGEEACQSEHSPRSGQILVRAELISVASLSRDSRDGPISRATQLYVHPWATPSRRRMVPSQASTSPATSLETSGTPAASPAKRNKRRNGKKAKDSKPAPPAPRCDENANDDQSVIEFSAATSNVLTLFCLLTVFGVLFFSDNNLFAARTILRAPVFTAEECQHVIEMARAAANRNADDARKERESLLIQRPEFMDSESTGIDDDDDDVASGGEDRHAARLKKLDSLLEEPSGWTKDRHSNYPTTDLNLVTDQFAPEDRAWLANKLNARLTPVVERSFGVFRGAIRANDIFVVRYDAARGQASLRRHTDSSHLSFNVLLNDGFEGGGTRFHNRQDGTHLDIMPDVGEALISHAQILHEGLATTKGTRYILVGFDSIDATDPLTGESTNLSVFSSWLNFPWMHVRFREGWLDGAKGRRRARNNAGDDTLKGDWKHSRYAVSLFRDLTGAMNLLIDRFAPFRSLKVIDTDDPGKYFEAMDRAMEEQNRRVAKRTRGAGYASWFRGQQIDLDVFGNFKSIWSSRSGKEDKFRGEDL